MTRLSLIDGSKGEPRVDSRMLAEHLGNQHKAVMALVDRYADKFKAFGILPFKKEVIKGRGQPERYALLCENQAYFLLSLSRNTDRVVNLKVKLVQAFQEARAGKAAIAVEYLPGYRQLHDKAHELASGSKNEKFVHVNLNKLINKTVGLQSGQRSRFSSSAMSLTVVAQALATQAMDDAKDHHEGYEKAKRALSALDGALAVRSA
jgi:phage regulator Rha-like protein